MMDDNQDLTEALRADNDDSIYPLKGIEPLLNPEPLSPDRLPMLQYLAERTGQAFVTNLKTISAAITDVKFKWITSCRYEDYVNDQKDDSIYCVGIIDGHNTRLLTELPYVTAKALVSAILGGRVKRDMAPLNMRSLTNIEQKYTETVSTQLMRALTEAVKQFTPISCRHERADKDIRNVSIVQLNAPVFVVNYVIVIGEAEASLKLILPLITLDPIKDQLSQRFSSDHTARDHEWREDLQFSTDRINIPTEIVVAEDYISLARIRDILCSQPDDPVRNLEFFAQSSEVGTLMANKTPISYLKIEQQSLHVLATPIQQVKI